MIGDHMNIPDGWERKTIKELGSAALSTVQTGPFGAQLHAEDYVEEGVPLLLIRNLKDGRLDSDGMPRVSDEDASRLSRYQLASGDVVFSRVGRVGSCFLAEPCHTGWLISGQLLRVRLPDDVIHRPYLYRALTSKYAQDHIGGESVGTTRTSINTKILESLALLIPPREEQTQIAAVLSELDQAIEQTEALIAKQQHIKTGLMQDLLTKGIDEHGNIRSEAIHAFKDSPLGRIPVEWGVAPLKSYISFLSYGFTNPMPEAVDGPYLVTAANVKDGKIDYDGCRRTDRIAFDMLLTPKSRPRVGDVLITKDGTLGRIAIVDRADVCINQSVAVIRFRENLSMEFGAMLLSSPMYQDLILADAGGSTIKHIYISKLDKLPIAAPKDVAEQKKILGLVTEQVRIIEGHYLILAKLRRTKSGLMRDLLTGEHRVTPLLAQAAPQ